MSRLWQDQGRLRRWRNSGDCGEAQMDDITWRSGIETGKEAHKFPDGLQGQRSPLGTIRGRCSLYELEVGKLD